MGIKATIRTAAILSLFLLSGCGYFIGWCCGDTAARNDTVYVGEGRYFKGCNNALNADKSILWLKHPDAKCAEKSGHRRMRIPVEFTYQCHEHTKDAPPLVTLLTTYPGFSPLAGSVESTQDQKRIKIGINDTECGSYESSPAFRVDEFKKKSIKRYKAQSLDAHLTLYTPLKQGEPILAPQYFTYENSDAETFFTVNCIENSICSMSSATKDNSFHYRIDFDDIPPEDFAELNNNVIRFMESFFF